MGRINVEQRKILDLSDPKYSLFCYAIERLDQAGVEYCISGGFARWIILGGEFNSDIDIRANVRLERVEQLFANVGRR